MVETFTPAVCGSRARQRLALALFAAGALVAAACVGAVLGLAGSLAGTRGALIAAAALALLAALREAGLVRLPVPQSRRQVPDRWRGELPLPVWSAGYGAGLGVGFLTFQPVSTFWVACAGALALGRPVPAAACFALYGAGRALMTAWPRRRQTDPAAAVESLIARRALVTRANVAVLVVCAGLLAAAPASGATVVSLGTGFDPSVDGSTVARAQMDGGGSQVLVQPPNPDPAVEIQPAAGPGLDGDLLAYMDSSGIRVVNWRTGAQVGRINGAVSQPALDWPLLAFRRDDASYDRLMLANLTNAGSPQERQIAAVPAANDLGRPSLRYGRLAWHRIRQRDSSVIVLYLASGRRRVIARSDVWMLSNPAVAKSRIAWVEQRSGIGYLRLRRLDNTRVRTIATLKGRPRFFWTTALAGRNAYVTRWAPGTQVSTLLRVHF
ncbi:MAG: hypothetical protein ABI649_04045 [Gaiellaceae bacterium]